MRIHVHVIRAVFILSAIFVIGFGAGPAVAAPNAAIVMDMRNGDVLYARSADERRHPASLTKMMTLYLAFEAVKNGQLRLDQKIRVSRHAARMPASKLYLKSGRRYTLRSLIRATAIKSANDAAMVLAEAIGGSQKGFARLMTQKAKQLGMHHTQFKNPHGLTQKGHYTTARDMAILARHLFFDYPQYYNIFKRKTDYAAGKRIWNTNRMLSSYRGADGIKTGYTRAAGYNLAASAHRGNKRIIAVQMGASSSRDRSRKVAKLLDIGFKRAKNSVKRVRPRGTDRSGVVLASAPLPPRRPIVPVTGLAAVADTFSAEAQAATIDAAVAMVQQEYRTARRAKAHREIKVLPSASDLAPESADRPTARRFLTARGRPYPTPVPRPIRLAQR